MNIFKRLFGRKEKESQPLKTVRLELNSSCWPEGRTVVDFEQPPFKEEEPKGREVKQNLHPVFNPGVERDSKGRFCKKQN